MSTEYSIYFVGGEFLTITCTGFETRLDGVFWFYNEVQEFDQVVQKFTLAVPKDNVLYIAWEANQ